MRYTIWSHGEIFGSTELNFRSVGWDRCRSGDFYLTGRAAEIISELASPSTCMRAYFHRDYRDADGNDLLDPNYVVSDLFADVAEHMQRTARFELELRDDAGNVIATTDIGIQDKEPNWPPPLTDAQLAEYMAKHPVDERDGDLFESSGRMTKSDLREAIDHDRKVLEEMRAKDELFMEGAEYFETPLDVTTPVGWEYEEQQGNNELGSGWNDTLREIRVFPRYQVHVLLAPG